MATDQLTPARLIRFRDLVNNRRAMESLLPSIDPPPDWVLDIRYGVGDWAKAVRRKFPAAHIVGFELDEETAEGAWKDANVDLFVEAWVPQTSRAVDLLLADFNMTTVLHRDLLDEAVKAISPGWLIFTDVAAGKLHLNYRSYGLESSDLSSYWRGFVVKGYRLVRYERTHRAASTALYQRKNPGG